MFMPLNVICWVFLLNCRCLILPKGQVKLAAWKEIKTYHTQYQSVSLIILIENINSRDLINPHGDSHNRYYSRKPLPAEAGNSEIFHLVWYSMFQQFPTIPFIITIITVLCSQELCRIVGTENNTQEGILQNSAPRLVKFSADGTVLWLIVINIV